MIIILLVGCQTPAKYGAVKEPNMDWNEKLVDENEQCQIDLEVQQRKYKEQLKKIF